MESTTNEAQVLKKLTACYCAFLQLSFFTINFCISTWTNKTHIFFNFKVFMKKHWNEDRLNALTKRIVLSDATDSTANGNNPRYAHLYGPYTQWKLRHNH